MKPKISENEIYIMNVLWMKSPQSGSEICKEVSKTTDWSQSTILTMIRRLAKKEAIGTIDDTVKLYYPLVEEQEIIKTETNKFLDRVYKGSANMMIRGILENTEISEKELSEIKQMLDDLK